MLGWVPCVRVRATGSSLETLCVLAPASPVPLAAHRQGRHPVRSCSLMEVVGTVGAARGTGQGGGCQAAAGEALRGLSELCAHRPEIHSPVTLLSG